MCQTAAVCGDSRIFLSSVRYMMPLTYRVHNKTGDKTMETALTLACHCSGIGASGGRHQRDAAESGERLCQLSEQHAERRPVMRWPSGTDEDPLLTLLIPVVVVKLVCLLHDRCLAPGDASVL
ncbi:hypothetical protein NDU88_005496 [Pleurodeles waltl]|uniref:Uncharacterized protein n=1 Tax=Pleurodeles waltl TaxID=8319 RepID=A0AAV7RIP5_PLEWA|nr:hypothetical protein NDU88_005496 [Pleurodeles waltl]